MHPKYLSYGSIALMLALSAPLAMAASSISLEKTCPTEGETDSSIDYAYSIQNGTGKSLKEHVITVTLDSKLGYLSYSGSGWQCAASSNIVTCTSTSKIKKNKSSTTLTISATTPPTTTSVTTSASASSNTQKSSSRNYKYNTTYTSSSVSCTTTLTNPAPGSFNATDSSGSCSGKAINTKIAGTSFPIKVFALNSARTSPDTTVNDPVEVYLLDFANMAMSPSGASSNCPNALSLNSQKRPNSYIAKATTTLGAGSGIVSFPPISKVYRKVGVFTVNTSNINNYACSTDLFAIRPKDFLVSASDSSWKTAGTTRPLNNSGSSGGNVHAAGRPFTLTATARDANGNAVADYNTLPASYFYFNDGTDDQAITPQVSIDAVLTPAGGDTPDISATFKPQSTAGQIRAVDAQLNDAGSFKLSVIDNQFAIEDAKNTCSSPVDRNIQNDSANTPVGRFIPEILTITALNTPQFKTFDASNTQCPSRKFTYVGQAFGFSTVPAFTVKAWAYDADGEYPMTGNHRFAGRLGSLSVSGGGLIFSDSTGRTLDTSAIGTASNTDANDGSTNIALPDNSRLAYTRTSSSAPFNANLSLNIPLADCTDKTGTGSNACIAICVDPNDLTDSNGTPPCNAPPATANATFSNIAFDATGTSPPNAFRYGFLSLPETVSVANATTALSLDLEAKYWTGSSWATNTLDNCTPLSAGQFTLSGYTDNLRQCNTLLSMGNQLSGGKSSLTLSAPGNGKSGSVKLMPNLGSTASGYAAIAPCTSSSPTASAANLPWLQCTSSLLSNCLGDNPQSTLSFGGTPAKANRTRYIYLRENY